MTLYSETKTKEYDGTALTAGTVYKNSNLEAVDAVFASEVLDLMATGSAADVEDGSVTNAISYTEGPAFRAENYNITTTEGTLTITSSDDLTVTGTDFKGIYDGTPCGEAAKASVEEGTAISYSVDGGKTWTTEAPTLTDAGSLKVTAKAENPNYRPAQCEYGITVSRRKITLTSSSAGKTYDGTPLTCENVTITGDGLAKGEGLSVKFTGSQTKTGTSKNAFEVVFDKNAKAGNYDVSCVYGTLTVKEGTKVPSTGGPSFWSYILAVALALGGCGTAIAVRRKIGA